MNLVLFIYLLVILIFGILVHKSSNSAGKQLSLLKTKLQVLIYKRQSRIKEGVISMIHCNYKINMIIHSLCIDSCV